MEVTFAGKLTAVLIAILSVFTGCSDINLSEIQSAYNEAKSGAPQNKSEYSGEVSSDGKLKMHCIDVGQGDSILIQTPDNKYMLVDAGETKDNAVAEYIDSLGIKQFEIVVATHPHADHISDMAYVINNYDINRFYMPNAMHTSKTFERMLDALEDRNVDTRMAESGIHDKLGEYVDLDFVAPCGEYGDDLNNWSAVIKLKYGKTSYLLTGDAEEGSEADILKSGADVSANVLKVGHHGSSTSSSEAFLDKVSPKIAVISCGQDNKYGHPHAETIKKLNDRNIEYYVTKDNGTVIVESDGENVKAVVGGV